MDTKLSKPGENAAEDSAKATVDIECSKRHDHSNDEDTHNPSLARHVLPSLVSNLACTGEISEKVEVGCFYQINYTKLPPEFPNQLKAIRVVMVAEKTELNVSVRFPTTLSLHEYFSNFSANESGANSVENIEPELDDEVVMGSKLARRVLQRRIPASEFAKQKHLQSFWFAAPNVTENPISAHKEGFEDDTLTRGICWSALKFAGVVNWGVRRRVTFIGRHRETSPQVPSGATKEEGETTKAHKRMIKRNRKRLRENPSRNGKPKETKHEKEKPGSNSQSKLKLAKDRWSAERYKLAEEKMLEIMKMKGAVFGKPMLRPVLRMEARKYIGDTGLLDHLLKHMSGKVAPGGKDRFRRRHNSEGAMEYWLESADLVNIRKESGIHDPYWNPPLGWKPGDSPSQDPICATELKLLKEEMANVKRDVQELILKKRKDEEETNVSPKASTNNSKLEYDTSASLDQLEIYNSLLKRKAQLEQQLVEISNSLDGMKEEIEKLTSSVEETAKSAVVDVEEEDKAIGELLKRKREEEEEGDKEEETAAAAKAKAEKRQRRRSGFRICKPQGTFLWPNMGGSSNMLSPQMMVQVEDLLVVPTPPSVSSAPRLIIPPPPLPNPTSPVKPLAERRAVSVSVSSVVIPESACFGDNITTNSTTIDLNNPAANNNKGNKNKYFASVGTPSSSSSSAYTYNNNCTRRTLLDTATVAAPLPPPQPHVLRATVEGVIGCEAIGSSGTTTTRMDMMYCQQQQQLHQGGRSSYVGVGAWLALATPNTCLDE